MFNGPQAPDLWSIRSTRRRLMKLHMWFRIPLLIVLLLAGNLFAQSNRATITGTVGDSSGAVLPDVQVSVTNTGTNDVATTTTNGSGLYSVRNLPIGSYAVNFSKS